MADNHTYPRGTVEFVSATVTADVELGDQAVALALSRDDDHTWIDAHWLGAAGTTRTVRTDSPITFSDDAFPHATYDVYVKVTDDPEVPIIWAGSLTIT